MPRTQSALPSLLRHGLLFALFVLLPTAAAARSPFFGPGDWVGYTDLRFVTAIAADDQTVYVATTGGVARYDLYAEQWRTPLTTSDGLLDNHVRDVFVDPNTDDVWFETDAGYSVLWPKGDTWRTAWSPPLPPQEGRPDLDAYAGLLMPFGYMFYPEGTITGPALDRYAVTDWWADRRGNLWVGTWGLGVGRADLRTLQLELYALGLNQADVTAIAVSGDSLWFGGAAGEGITLYDRARGTWRHFEARLLPRLRSDRVHAISAGRPHVWFGTTYGLSRYDPAADAWRTYTVFDTLQADEVTALAQDPTSLWIGTVSGVSRLNKQTGSRVNIPDPSLKFRYVHDIAVGAGWVWVATDAGVYRLDPAAGWEAAVPEEQGLPAGEVRAVAVSGPKVWFASADAVVSLDTRNGQWERYPALIYLGNSRPSCLAADREAVWVGTDQGVWKLDVGRRDWLHLEASDGLLDNRVQAIALDGDWVWFGTPTGATRFYWNSPHRLE